MKNLIKKIVLAVALLISVSPAQTVNWARANDNNEFMLNAKLGFEYGATLGLEFGYQIKTELFPIILNVEYSFPSGMNLTDDFKTRIGGQIRLFEYNNIQISGQLHGIFRRFENDFARLLNFGADAAGVLGYYRNSWFVAGEFGFDKAIVTHFKHTENYLSQYPEAKGGWYQPAQGGNYFYGLQGGVSFWNQDIFIRAGKQITQDFKTEPMIPFFGQVGYNIKF